MVDGVASDRKNGPPILLKYHHQETEHSNMTMTTPSQSYADVDVYIGIDVHHRTYSVHAQVG